MAPPASHHFIQETDHLQVSRQKKVDINRSATFLQNEIRKSATCQRDRTEAEEFRMETLRVEAEVREWMGRHARAASSVLASQDSGRLLAGMDVEARSLLGEDQGAK